LERILVMFPSFDLTAGISFTTDCNFRLQQQDKSKQGRGAVISFPVNRRSLYIIQRPERTDWQHSISPVKETGDSITLRTLREEKRGAAQNNLTLTIGRLAFSFSWIRIFSYLTCEVSFCNCTTYMLKCSVIIFLVWSGNLFAQNAACIPAITVTASQNNICLGTTVTFHASETNEGTNNVYKWKRNNSNAGVTNNVNYTSADFDDGDLITCEYSCKTLCGADTTVISKPVTMHVIESITPVITIENNDPLICEGELTVFTSQASYGNAVPSYQWKVNGTPVGTNSPDYATTNLSNGSRVECVLTISTAACPGTLRSASSEMNIYVYPMIHPAITITPGKTQICRGEEVTFTAKANGGAAPSFRWEVNGKPSGDVGPAFVSSTLKDGDSVSCTITIDQDSRCHTSTSAPSNKVAIQVRDYPDPTLVIATPAVDVCSGAAINFSATAQHAGAYKLYQWQINGRIAGNSSTFVSTQLVNGDTVSCTLSTNIPGCPITVNVPSNRKVVTVRKSPLITFSPTEVSVMCGAAALVSATVSGNPASVAWQPSAVLVTPQSLISVTVPLVADTLFILTVADINGCATTKELMVRVLHSLQMPSAFTPNKDGKNDVFRIPPGASLRLQEFSVFNRWGHAVFSTSDITKGWNGSYGGMQSETGTYVYFIRGIIQNQVVIIKGTVTLLR
jgi:gliding motility-associated-like protein